jgi:hypothetical protein
MGDRVRQAIVSRCGADWEEVLALYDRQQEWAQDAAEFLRILARGDGEVSDIARRHIAAPGAPDE